MDAALRERGRDPEQVGIIWATKVIVGETEDEAKAMRERLIADAPMEAVGVWLSHNTGFDMSTLPPRFSVRELNQRMAAIGGFPWVTCTIVGLNVAVFAAMAIATRRLGEFDPVQMLDWGANYGPLTISGPWWRLITALFLHGSLLHLLLNMWAFWNVGRLTERLYGNWCFAFLYFASGLLSSPEAYFFVLPKK